MPARASVADLLACFTRRFSRALDSRLRSPFIDRRLSVQTEQLDVRPVYSIPVPPLLPSLLSQFRQSARVENHADQRPRQAKGIEAHPAGCHASAHTDAMHPWHGAARLSSHNGRAQSFA